MSTRAVRRQSGDYILLDRDPRFSAVLGPQPLAALPFGRHRGSPALVHHREERFRRRLRVAREQRGRVLAPQAAATPVVGKCVRSLAHLRRGRPPHTFDLEV